MHDLIQLGFYICTYSVVWMIGFHTAKCVDNSMTIVLNKRQRWAESIDKKNLSFKELFRERKREQLSNLSIRQLKAKMRGSGIKDYGRLTKAELVEVLSGVTNN